MLREFKAFLDKARWWAKEYVGQVCAMSVASNQSAHSADLTPYPKSFASNSGLMNCSYGWHAHLSEAFAKVSGMVPDLASVSHLKGRRPPPHPKVIKLNPTAETADARSKMNASVLTEFRTKISLMMPVSGLLREMERSSAAPSPSRSPVVKL